MLGNIRCPWCWNKNHSALTDVSVSPLHVGAAFETSALFGTNTEHSALYCSSTLSIEIWPIFAVIVLNQIDRRAESFKGVKLKSRGDFHTPVFAVIKPHTCVILLTAINPTVNKGWSHALPWVTPRPRWKYPGWATRSHDWQTDG